LTGEESYDIEGIPQLFAGSFKSGQKLKVRARGAAAGGTIEFSALVRIDTPQESLYYQHGGILQYVLRQLKNAGK
jgi:aconitate hydratase